VIVAPAKRKDVVARIAILASHKMESFDQAVGQAVGEGAAVVEVVVVVDSHSHRHSHSRERGDDSGKVEVD
jgi:hypothetical protein